MRKAASSPLPKHAAVAGWKRRALSHVEQDGLPLMPKDRGAEQGDVDGPLEFSLALGMVAAEVRLNASAQQAARTLPWIGTDNPVEERLQAEHHSKNSEQIHDFQLGGSEKHVGADDPRQALQENGGLADLWYIDDGDILCHPILVLSYLQAFDSQR